LRTARPRAHESQRTTKLTTGRRRDRSSGPTQPPTKTAPFTRLNERAYIIKRSKRDGAHDFLTAAQAGRRPQYRPARRSSGAAWRGWRNTSDRRRRCAGPYNAAGDAGRRQNSLRIGSRGPTALEDFYFREKIFHFDHERIPERVVHARGFGAHGYFENYQSLADISRADLFQRPGEKTPAFVRFSTVAGSKGSPDLARDVRGFAVKLYTKQGNWDIVGNNIPVFFIQDAIKFPDIIHAAKEEPDRGFPQAQTAHDNFWDFISLNPESIHMALWIMSDRTIPRSFRFMEGFGVHTFRLVNAEGKSTFVKFHWKPKLGIQSVMWNEALKINGKDPDFHRRDMWDARKPSPVFLTTRPRCSAIFGSIRSRRCAFSRSCVPS
jgi:hypothetical protein